LGFPNNLALLVLEVREVSSGFLLSELCGPLLPLFGPASDDLRDTLVNLVTAVLLEVTSNVAQERDIKKGCRDQKQERAGEDKDSEEGRESEGRGNDSVPPEVFGDVVPFALVVLLRHVDSI